ncbi:hypothetical protein BH10ACT1_BH10ACT1_43090 [soil metagenome]
MFRAERVEPMERLLGADPRCMTAGERAEWVLAWDRARSALEAKALAVVGRWDAEADWAFDGAPTGPSWLAARCDLSGRAARALVRDARRLRAHPDSLDACERLGASKVREFARHVSDRLDDAYTADEATVLAALEPLTVDQTDRFAQHWQRLADTDGTDPGGSDDRRSTLGLGRGWAGRWNTNGELRDEDGETMHDALAPIIDQLRRSYASSDDGTPMPTIAELRAEALLILIRQATTVDPDTAETARPSITVIVDHQQLVQDSKTDLGSRTWRYGMAWSGPITGETARRMACDAGITRVITGPNSEPLDVGRLHHAPTRAQRRALAVRDRGCTFPGCGRPVAWCHAHHIIHWADGGPTDLANLALLCQHHHTLIHQGRFTLTRHPDGHLQFRRPDNTLIEHPRPHQTGPPATRTAPTPTATGPPGPGP